MRTATPKVTPMVEITVITETKVRFGFKYRRLSSSSKGSRIGKEITVFTGNTQSLDELFLPSPVFNA
jgi:hypothetical protein